MEPENAMTDFDKYYALKALQRELDSLLDVDANGFCRKVGVWKGSVDAIFAALMEELVARNE